MGIGQPRPQWAGTEGVVKKGRERGKREGKNHPCPSLVSFGGPGWGAQKSFPREENFHSSLVPGRPDLASGRNPHWIHRRQDCVFVVGPVFDCPLCEDSDLLPSLSGQLREVFASRLVGGR